MVRCFSQIAIENGLVLLILGGVKLLPIPSNETTLSVDGLIGDETLQLYRLVEAGVLIDDTQTAAGRLNFMRGFLPLLGAPLALVLTGRLGRAFGRLCLG